GDQLLDRGLVEITYGDNGHQFGAVPIRIEFLQAFGLPTLDDLRLSNRNAIVITRPFEHEGPYLGLHSLAGAASYAPFFHDHPALLFNFRWIECYILRPVLEDQQRLIHRFRFVGGDLE